MILFEVIWWLFSIYSAWGAICLHFFRHTEYVGKSRTHYKHASIAAKEMGEGEKNDGVYMDKLVYSYLAG